MDFVDEANHAETMLERALALWEVGFHVFPLGDRGDSGLAPPKYFRERYDSDEEAAEQWPKTPRISWLEFQTRQASEDEVRQWWTKWPQANIAIATGAQVFVVDADNADVVEWCESGAITRTPWRVRTSRGTHYYYKANDLDLRNSASSSKLDIRGTGGYVVAPGSVHGSGASYTLECDHGVADMPDELPGLTADDLGAINQFIVNAAPRTGESGVLFDGSRVQLKASGGPVAEGGRNNAAASLAGQYIEQGMSLREIQQVLAGWNQKNNPPLSPDELEHTVASVARTHTRNHPDQPILMEKRLPTPEAGESAAETPAPQGPAKLQLFTIRELMDEPPKRPEYLWQGAAIFKGSRILVAAEPKAGKTRFVMDLSKSMATGTDFLGAPTARPLKVLYFNAEVHKAWLPDRTRPIINSLAPEHVVTLRDHLAITGRVDLDVQNPLDNDLIRQVHDSFRPDITIYDPLINFCAANENDNTEMRAVLRAIDEIATDFNTGVILVHHTAKGGGKFDRGPFDRIRGASALRGWYDTGIVLTKTGGAKHEVTVAYEMRNGHPLSCHNVIWCDNANSFVKTIFIEPESGEPAAGSAARDRALSLADAMEPGRWYLKSELLAICRKRGWKTEHVQRATFEELRDFPEIGYEQVGRNAARFIKEGTDESE